MRGSKPAYSNRRGHGAYRVTDMSSDRFLSAAQLCERYGVVKSTIHGWVICGVLPAPHKFGGGSARWKLSELEAREKQIGEARPERPFASTAAR